MSIDRREYKNYDEYLSHQSLKSKIGRKKKIKKFMMEYVEKDVSSFETRIGKFKKYVKNGKVLCLGARTGSEVLAFRNLGFKDTIGIDLNPGENNEYVIEGDFHDMPFSSGEFTTVYTNCIDHAWDLEKLSKEIHRVISPEGRLILEIDHLKKKTKKDRKELLRKSSKYESLLYDGIDDISDGLKDFNLINTFDSGYSILLGIVYERK
jgi:SAM-dependent methyltransferase